MVKGEQDSIRFAAGATAGAIAAVGLQPFDVIKTQQQAAHTQRIGAFEALSLTYRHHGASGLWRGSAPTLLRVVLGAGVYFTCLGHLLGDNTTPPKNARSAAQRKQASAAHTFAAGFSARAFAAALLCPLTVIKTRAEFEVAEASMVSSAEAEGSFGSARTRSTQPAIGVLGRLKAVAGSESFAGLYSGLGATLIRDAPYSGIFVMLYTQLKTNAPWAPSKMEDHSGSSGSCRGGSGVSVSPSFSNFASGCVAGVIATAVTHPADVVKTRMQLDKGGGEFGRKTLRQTVRVILAADGFSGFWRGAAPRLMKRTLATTMTWVCFEEMLERMRAIAAKKHDE